MSRTMKKVLAGAAAFAAIAFGASAIAGAASSSSTGSTTTTTTPSTSGAPAGPTHAAPAFNGPAHGTAAHEDAEKPVTGDAASKAQAAAVKYVGSGTAGAVTTDYTKTGYETTVTKSDGSKVTVKVNADFSVASTEDGMK